MDLITQFLAALVIILALALYNRSSTLPTTSYPDSPKSTSSASRSKKSNKKKKKPNGKGENLSAPPQDLPLSISSNEASDTHISTKKQSSTTKSAQSGAKSVTSNLTPSSIPSSSTDVQGDAPTAGQSQYGIQSNGHSQSTHLPDSSTKTNEQRRAEINRKKTGRGEARVADMIDRDIQPEVTYQAVARIPAPEPAQSNSFGLHDHEEWEQLPVEDQGGWESVGQGSRSSRLQSSLASTSKNNGSSNGVSSYASNNPFAALPDGVDSSYASVGKNGAAKSLKIPSSRGGASKSLGGSAISNGSGSRASQSTANAEPTKKQRQNAAKAAAKKAQRESEEIERLERLAKHKKEVEGQRMKDFYTKGAGSKPASKTSGGPKASVNQNGALVWD